MIIEFFMRPHFLLRRAEYHQKNSSLSQMQKKKKPSYYLSMYWKCIITFIQKGHCWFFLRIFLWSLDKANFSPHQRFFILS